MLKYFCGLALFLLLVGCSESFTDGRDGQSYKMVHIGSLTWMAENLNYSTSESFCADGDERNCKKFGRLYTWDDALKICPDGWRLPSNEDFENLIKTAGGETAAGLALKSSSGWYKKGDGKDQLGFGALPSGFRSGSGKFDGIGGYAYFWSTSVGEEDLAYYLFLDFSSPAAKLNTFVKTDARSVRCVKN